MHGLKWWSVACLLWVEGALAIVGGQQAAKPEADAVVVFTQKHGRSSRVEGVKHNKFNVYSFFGIRYAEPPVGYRRFQRPVRQYMAGEVLATRPCTPCPQLDPRNPSAVIGEEDCLCLNVFAPKMPGDEKGSPVVVFFHGGNYKSGSSIYYGGAHFAANDTILVTVQYRLGALGFLSTGKKDAAGNNGLFDMHMAKTWVMDYIEFFGGDPQRLVLMGQGSGGSAASLLALSKEDSGVQGVVALSGTPLSPGAVRSKDDPKIHANMLANKTSCKPEPAEKFIGCLREKTIEDIVLADSQISSDPVDTIRFIDEISGRAGAAARIEGVDDERSLPPLIAEKPMESMKMKRRRCAFLTGVTSAETSRAVYGKYSKFLTDKLQMVRDFVQNELIGNLQKVVAGVEDLIPLGQSKQLENMKRYYQFITDSAIDDIEGLTKIAEATADALFNLPAYQSVKTWSDTSSPAFMFSFEHQGNLTKGSHFLPGVALAETSKDAPTVKSTGPSHGDELAYLFEALDEEGKPVPETLSESDATVRSNFLKFVSKFIHASHEENKTKDSSFFGALPFSTSTDQFFTIGEEINVGKNFRFCQMGMWGGIGDRVSGTFCQNILAKLPKLKLPVPVPVPQPGDLLNGLGKITQKMTNVLPTAAGTTKSDKENEIEGSNTGERKSSKKNNSLVNLSKPLLW